MKTYLRLEAKAGEELPGVIGTEQGLTALLDDLYDRLNDDQAVEIHVYREFVLVGTREKGHGDIMTKKFINFGFSPKRQDNKSEALAFAIRSIDDGSLPEYCYRAINGDIDALRQTTTHLVRAYEAKIRRMTEKNKPFKEIEAIQTKRDIAKKRLELDDEEFVEVSEPIILEIPKNIEKFYAETDVYLGEGVEESEE